MKIIICGPDNVGKGTQIDNIRKAFKDKGFIVSHSNFIKGFTPEEYRLSAKKEYSNMFEIFNTWNPDMNIICDRLHGGETVYGPIYRQYTGDYVFDLEKEYNLDNINDLFLIVIVDEADNLISREDGLSFSTDKSLKEQEIALFQRFYSRSTIKNKILININNKSISKVKDIILDFLKDNDA